MDLASDLLVQEGLDGGFRPVEISKRMLGNQNEKFLFLKSFRQFIITSSVYIYTYIVFIVFNYGLNSSMFRDLGEALRRIAEGAAMIRFEI